MKKHIDFRNDAEAKKFFRNFKRSKRQRDLRKYLKKSDQENTVPGMKKFNSAIEKAMNTKVDVDLNEFLRFAVTVQRKDGHFYYTMFNGRNTYSNGKLAIMNHKLDASDSMYVLFWLKEFLIDDLRYAFENDFEVKVSRKKLHDQIHSLTGSNIEIEGIDSYYDDKGIYSKNK